MTKSTYLVIFAILVGGFSANEQACMLCIDIVSTIENFLNDGATQDDIIAWAEQVLLFIYIKSKDVSTLRCKQ